MTFNVQEVHKTNKNQIKKMYVQSIKKEEQIPFQILIFLSKIRNSHFYAYYENDEIIGLSFFGVKKNITFIKYIVVDEIKRSLGYGKLILNHIQNLYPNNKIILTIELSDNSYSYAQRNKRKKFYIMNGFMETDYYVKINKKKQEILIKNGKFHREELFLFFLKYSNFTRFKKIYKKIKDVK